ncbi:MAG: hypothetical protein LBD58_05480 [Treponema sp.]|nr:hypothetical protein [Treponema sp.]
MAAYALNSIFVSPFSKTMALFKTTFMKKQTREMILLFLPQSIFNHGAAKKTIQKKNGDS